MSRMNSDNYCILYPVWGEEMYPPTPIDREEMNIPIEVGIITKFGERYLALQSIERSKNLASGVAPE